MCKGGTGAIHPLFQAYHSVHIDTIRPRQYELGRGSDSAHFLANRRVDYSLTAAVPVSWPLTHAGHSRNPMAGRHLGTLPSLLVMVSCKDGDSCGLAWDLDQTGGGIEGTTTSAACIDSP